MPGPGYGPPDYQYQGPEMTNGHYSNGEGVFSFKKRFQRIDWRKLAAVDVDRIARELDFNTLQDNVMNIAFCNIETEVDTRQVDTNFVKLFKLAQLTIEYLLHSQDFLATSIRELEDKVEKIQQEHGDTKKLLDKKVQELAEAKKESHKRKKLLASQQQLMSVGPKNYNQCPYCPKSFMNLSFLQSHLVRRHGEQASGALFPSPQQPVSQPVNTQPYEAQSGGDSQVSPLLVKELNEIKERLRFTESQLETERSVWKSRNQKEQDETAYQLTQQRQELEQWKQEQLEEQRQERDARENMLMREIRELNEKMAMSDRTIHDLQKRVGKTSHLGNLQDDIDLDREELDKQRAEMAVINEQLSSKLKDVESRFAEETKKLKQKIKSRDESHREEIEKLTDVMHSNLASQRDSSTKAGKAESDAIRKQLDDIQRHAKKERMKREQLEKNLLEKEQELKDMASRPPTVAPRKPPASPTPEVKARPPSPIKSEKPERPPAIVPREEEIPVKRGSHIEVPKVVETPPSGEDEGDGLEDEDISSEVSVSSLGTTTGQPGKDTGEYMTGTTTSLGSATGTMEMSLTSKNERVLQVLKKDPKFLEAMREELSTVLDDALEKRGISASATGVSVPIYQNKITLLKTERQQKAKKHSNFYDIRQQYINQVDEMARERLRGSKKAGGGSGQSGPQRQTPPKTVPFIKQTPTPKTPAKSSTPSFTSPKAASTPMASSTPKAASTPNAPKPEPRSQSPVKNPGLSQTFSSTATSSQWESEDLSFPASDSEATDDEPEKADVPKPQPMKPVARTDDQDDDDEWDSEEVSSATRIAPILPVMPDESSGKTGENLDTSRNQADLVQVHNVNELFNVVKATVASVLPSTESKMGLHERSPPPVPPRTDLEHVGKEVQRLETQQSTLSLAETMVKPFVQSSTQSLISGQSNSTNEQAAAQNDDEFEDIWNSPISELDEISPSKTAAGSQAKAYSTPKPKGALVSELTKSIEMQLTGRGVVKKPAGGVDLAPPESARDGASPATPEIQMLGEGAEDEGSDFSLTSEEGVKPARGTREIESTNTYGTSVWGGSSSKAASSINPAQGTGKSSLVSVTDWDSEDSDLNLDDL